MDHSDWLLATVTASRFASHSGRRSDGCPPKRSRSHLHSGSATGSNRLPERHGELENVGTLDSLGPEILPTRLDAGDRSGTDDGSLRRAELARSPRSRSQAGVGIDGSQFHASATK